MRDVCTFWYVFAYDTISIFNGAFFPRMIGVTEINMNLEKRSELLMVSEQDVVVGGDGAEFRKTLLDTKECVVDVNHGHLKNPLDERDTELSIHHHKQDTSASLARDDEVSFGIASSHSSIDMLGSFVDEHTVRERAGACTSPPGALSPLVSV